MDPFVEHLRKWIAGHFENARVHFEAYPGGRVGGIMAWAGFDGVPQRERQRTLWDHLRELPSEEQMRISAILTLTPTEQEGYLENATEDDF